MISVIVPVKDGAGTLQACLDALLAQEGLRLGEDYEVIVVDDGSQDGSGDLAERAGVRVIRQANAGPAAARNHGAEHAQGGILAFTDADCAPTPGWLRALTAPFANPEVMGVKGAYATRERGLVPRFVQVEYAHKYARMRRQERIDFIDTYSAAYRREVFLQNGGFDPVFPVPSVEDQEFSFRLAAKGYRLVFQPSAVVLHAHDRTLAEYVRRKYNIGYWKAVMLNWLPEKAFSDAHTPPSQRWQIVLLGLALLGALGGLAWARAAWLSLAALAGFALSALPFAAFVSEADPPVLAILPAMLLARAAALGAGVVSGFLRRPRGLPRKGFSLSQRAFKRGMDLLGGLLGALLSAPILLIAAAAIRLDSPGPAFFSQLRAGEGGRPFKIYKLRTMVCGAEDRLEDVLGGNHLRGAAFKIPADPRVTRVGRFLRRWSLDELPQFWNILKGEMSLVGPRPEELRVVAAYSDEERRRLAVKPGLTGPMQVSGRGDLDMPERLRLELDYIQNYSPGKDFEILLRSVGAILSGKGAY